MSADRQRLVNAIRRMALTPEERRQLLGDSANRGDQAGSGAKAASQGEEERICCDGSTAPANLGTEERDPDSGGQDASGGLDPNDPANLDMGAGSLTGLTDCSTGEPVCFNGSGFIPPDGWDEPNEPPVVESYKEGFYWQTTVLSGGSYTCPNIIPLASAQCYADALDESNDGEVLSFFKVSEGRYEGEVRFFSGASNKTRDIQTIDFECNGDPVCDEDPPLETAWPSDGCVNLAIKGGTIVGSKYDPDQDGSYSKPLTEINLCDGAGNQIRLAPSADGGWKTLDAINGGDGYLYDSQGQQIARISGDEFSDPTI